MKPELLDCPFCGHEAVATIHACTTEAVRCTNRRCRAQMTEEWPEYTPPGLRVRVSRGKHHESDWDPIREWVRARIAKRWNRRSSSLAGGR